VPLEQLTVLYHFKHVLSATEPATAANRAAVSNIAKYGEHLFTVAVETTCHGVGQEIGRLIRITAVTEEPIQICFCSSEYCPSVVPSGTLHTEQTPFILHHVSMMTYTIITMPSSFRRDLKTELFIRAYHQHEKGCTETGEFGVRGETLGPPNPGRVSAALEMKL